MIDFKNIIYDDIKINNNNLNNFWGWGWTVLVESPTGVGLATQAATAEVGACCSSLRARRAAASKELNPSLVLSDFTLMNPANACFLAMVGRSLNPLHPLREATKAD